MSSQGRTTDSAVRNNGAGRSQSRGIGSFLSPPRALTADPDRLEPLSPGSLPIVSNLPARNHPRRYGSAQTFDEAPRLRGGWFKSRSSTGRKRD